MRGPAVSVVGLGYVGLSTAVCFAHRGLTVYGVEVDPNKLSAISRGEVPFKEEGMDRMLRSVLKAGRLRVSGGYDDAVAKSAITYITVGTPSRPDGSIDLAYVRACAETLGRHLAGKAGYHTVVVKSTAVPGTTEGPVREALERGSGKKVGQGFGLSANPEFLREGSAVKDTFHPDAVVIGSLDGKSRSALLSLYKRFYGRLPPVVLTTPSNAELIKYSVNTFRATQLSFLNTLANLCQSVPGMDVEEVARGFAMIAKPDPRYLKAGIGYGGSCLPKDLRALIAESRRLGVDPQLLESSLRVNEAQPERAIDLAVKATGPLRGRRVAVLGLAFKANTDDIRESSAITLVKKLVAEGADVTAYDPAAMPNSRAVLEGAVRFAKGAKECLKGAEVCILATGWPEFAKLRAADFLAMARPFVVDGRGALDAEKLGRGGVEVLRVGVGKA